MIGTILLTLLKGSKIGSDQYGNQYFQERFILPNHKNRQPRRWVVYKGKPEGSKVPAEWHGWLHFTTSQPPKGEITRYFWQKNHLPNLTGTKKCYQPNIDRFAKHYKAWTPNDN